MNDLFVWFALSVMLLILVSSLDDLFVDIWTLARVPRDRFWSLRLTTPPAETTARQPLIAVFVANWHEEEILGSMVAGNLAAIDYRPFKLYLGVYPNDDGTLRVAMEMAAKYPDRVGVIINRLAGPTSKGQMLNEMFEQVFADPRTAPDLVVMHDSEDLIDPCSFALYAALAERSHFIQIPVFSLDSRHRSLVGATYMDEFAERHSREMILRNTLGVAIPSAGVGTGLRKDLILYFLRKRGQVLRSGCVTEDYILGNEAHQAGFTTTFAFRRADRNGLPSIVATREYFPRSFRAAVRQKTRWIYGICFEGLRTLERPRTLRESFFLYRDCKGALTNLAPLLALVLLVPLQLKDGGLSPLLTPELRTALACVVLFNTICIGVRYGFKVVSHREVYGRWNLLGVALRWPVSIVINAFAVLRAWDTFIFESHFASRPIVWAKTDHEAPDFNAFSGSEPQRLRPVPRCEPGHAGMNLEQT